MSRPRTAPESKPCEGEGCTEMLYKRPNDGAQRWEARRFHSRDCARAQSVHKGIVYRRKEEIVEVVVREYEMPKDFQSLKSFQPVAVPPELQELFAQRMWRGALV